MKSWSWFVSLETQIDEIKKNYDLDRDGIINYNEFKLLLKGTFLNNDF